MDKLISAERLCTYIKAQINPYGKPFEGSAYDFGLKIMDHIGGMDAAYNLDRVVEQLKDLKPYKLDLADAMMDTLENGKYRHFVCQEEVLNIVKAGGIDDSQI